MRHKSSKTIQLLELIGSIGGAVADILEVIISSPYGSSLGKLQYELS